MQFNRRVYLAKSNLASGLDFEYVKSNLLRIPGIEIIEYGDGINPSECACMVYIPEPQVTGKENILISKNVSNTIQEYLDAENDGDLIFIFQVAGEAESFADVEPTTPIVCGFRSISLENAQSWDAFASMDLIIEENYELCSAISSIIGAKDYWLKYPRHYVPKKEYCLPPIPTVEQRRSKGTKGHYILDEAGMWDQSYKYSTQPGKVEKAKEEYIPTEGERERYSNAKSRRKERLL